MNLNKITYDKIQSLMDRICLMEHTKENIKINFHKNISQEL